MDLFNFSLDVPPQPETSEGEYVCYCNKVTKQEILAAIESGAKDVKEVIAMTGAMQNSNCKVNNPKGRCCYQDIVAVFDNATSKVPGQRGSDK